ncbi:MAG: hypothetical protein DCC55_17555 [Chloroflexi bacterium]|nr:MAG: hypothetical protein DCC55_17555 [Chloroflexota bacterium]
MSKRTSTVEWIVAESDADWARLCTRPGAGSPSGVAPVTSERRYAQRILAGVGLMLLLLASAGGWWHHTTSAGAQQHATAEGELPVVAQRDGRLAINSAGDQSSTEWWYQLAREYDGLLTATQTTDPDEPLHAALRNIDFQGDQAVAEVILYAQDNAPVYRQTRFYQRAATGWLTTAPDANLWGPMRSLETPSFVFHFRQRDAAVVVAVAAQVEALYRTMRRNLGLESAPGARKLVIHVSVTQPPRHTSLWFGAPKEIIAASPALYRAPVELADTELLAQSLALPLFEHVLTQAQQGHATPVTWQPLESALRLWQLWDLDLPLADWREEVVKWIYIDLPTKAPRQAVVLPRRYRELCAAHMLWLLSPVQIHLPLFCAGQDQTQWDFYWRASPDPLVHLDQLAVPVALDSTEYGYPLGRSQPGQTIALATLIDYGVATYGRERLPALVAGLRQHNTWETLVPAVYGVSAAEFEAGWHDYLATQYGIHVFKL